MVFPTSSIASFHKVLRRFRRNRRGAAAIEFALVAPIFSALLFAIIETALVFFAGQLLETATQDSARMILTGQAQQGSYTQQQFANYVCTQTQVSVLFDCNKISIDVQSYPSFSNVTINNQIDSSGNFINNMQYNPGGAGDIVVVRLFYQWPIYVTGLGYNIANLSGSKRLLVATAAFKNEPY
ncbi:MULTISPECIES: TadE/TadG family type IV pilus assembly protein [unclassified Bradyrhizobium]|uniref:TadE/TadG family type IV pilus assembly protein n=1 Tax=unclassified Bradyrhizobium TaxID=2631580 RepID=UPI0028ED40D0|nr:MULTISPECIES: TadE/TadG family type IV pilus assembly protein [unclassified Bradyrhizobium]